MKLLGIDYGDARIGIAISDDKGIIAFPKETYHRVNKAKDINYIIKLCLDNNIEKIVVGDPINMDGTFGFRHEKTLSFVKNLEKKMKHVYSIQIPIVLWDEALSTVEAGEFLHVQNKKGKKKKDLIDAIAASIILESFINSERN